MLFDSSFSYFAIMSIEMRVLLFLWKQKLSAVMKLQIFPDTPEYHTVTSKFFFWICRTTIWRHHVTKPSQKSIEKYIAWAIAGGLPNKEKQMPLPGSWTCYQKETAIKNMKNLKSIDCLRFPKVQNILFVKHIVTFW